MIDLTYLLKVLAEEEEAAKRALTVAQLRLANIRGQRRGMERTIEAINRQAERRPVITEGEEA